MSSEWLLFIFLIAGIALAFDITRRALISIFESRSRQKAEQAMRRLRRPVQPWVTVLVYGRNQAKALEKTVRQVRRSRYSMFDIVAVNDSSGDDTAKRMREYCIKKSGKVQVQFLQRRHEGTKQSAYRAAYQKSHRGEIILLFQAGQKVDPSCIKRAVISQEKRNQWKVELTQDENPDTLRGIASTLQSLLLHKKSAAFACTPTALRREKLKTDGYIHIGQACTQLVILGVIILGILYAGITALWYAWLLFSMYALALIWIHFEISISQKWKYTFSVPSALFLIPVVEFTEGLTQLRIRK